MSRALKVELEVEKPLQVGHLHTPCSPSSFSPFHRLRIERYTRALELSWMMSHAPFKPYISDTLTLY